MEILAVPGRARGPGRITRHSGDAARTRAGSPPSVTWSASTSPWNAPPQIGKASCNETTDGIEIVVCAELGAGGGSISAAAEEPEALATRTLVSEGVRKTALPVLSVFTRTSIPECEPRSTITPSASRPSTPRTARGAGLSATSFGGSTMVTAQVVEGLDCGRVTEVAPKKRMSGITPMRKIGRSRTLKNRPAAVREPFPAVILSRAACPAHRFFLHGTRGKDRDQVRRPGRNLPESKGRVR